VAASHPAKRGDDGATPATGITMKLLTKFNLILLPLFGLGGWLISHLAYDFLIADARRQVMQEAGLMLASASAVRDYTTSNLAPLLSHRLETTTTFHPETVPAFSASMTFNKLRERYPDYGYKEATLNPTNPADRAADWESDVIRSMRDHPERKQVIGERDAATGRSLYLASPLTAGVACMECHSVPAVAPASLIALYGSANGFGWKRDEIVGAQIVSVPMSVPVAIANQAYRQLLAYLIATLVVTIVALDAGMYLLVIRPLRLVSRTADRISTGEKDVPSLAVNGTDEIAQLTMSFNRMRVSLRKALSLLR
jgi:HAMP domain-containing protein